MVLQVPPGKIDYLTQTILVKFHRSTLPRSEKELMILATSRIVALDVSSDRIKSAKGLHYSTLNLCSVDCL